MSSNGKRDEDGDKPDLDETTGPVEAVDSPAIEDDETAGSETGAPSDEMPEGGEEPRTAADGEEIEDAVIVEETAAAEDASTAPEDSATEETASIKEETEPAAEELPETGYAATGEDPGGDETKPDFTEEMRGAPQPAAAATAAEPVAPPPPPASRGGFLPALLGGIVAAGLGFGAAYYVLGGFDPESPDPVEAAVTAQGEQLSALESQIAGIADRLSQETPDPTADRIAALSDKIDSGLGSLDGQLKDLSGSVGSLGDRLGNVESRLGQVDDRLTAVEKRPLVESSETAKQAFAAYERELDELRQSLSDQQTQNQSLSQQLDEMSKKAQADLSQIEQRAGTLQDQAEQAARQGAIREALASLDSDLARGAPFAAPLKVLSDNGVALPEPLTENSESGVASLSELRSSFPAAAREALDSSLQSTAAEIEDMRTRITAFLRDQTGARSLTPHEGDDPDAVLSRAEAAVAAGDLQTALTELEALPEAGREDMADWIQRARTRMTVVEAVSQLPTDAPAN